jgi:hypothetical protein
MADDDETTEPAPDRLDRLETTVERIAETVKSLVKGTGPAAKAHAGAQQAVEGHLAAPADVESQVAAALAERDRKAQEDALHADVGSLKETVAGLTEKPPEQPQRRVEKIMGWGK